MKTMFIIFYFSLLFIVAFYGIHLYWLIILYLRSGRDEVKPSHGPIANKSYPYVTIQLPLYNEKSVVIRLIESATAINWPSDKIEVQVLDDSNDETSKLIANFLNDSYKRTIPVIHIRRSSRHGFKAGALAHGLESSKGEYVAIFDADNIPEPDFLTKLMPYFNDSSVGMVQARWSFLNRNESYLCRAQALFLDAHFRIEQRARSFGDLLFNFNGTAGIWKISSIESAGGWQHDTLTEDFDLSIRAQLSGWNFKYIDSYAVPTELPNTITAFKTQQYRWAKGAVETGLKLFPRIIRSELSLKAKIASFFHFSHKGLSLALLLLAISLMPALYIRLESGTAKLLFIDLPIFLAGTGSMTLFYTLANRHSNSKFTLRNSIMMPLLTSLGVALSVTNSKAVLSALFGRTSEFIRTPKSGSTDKNQQSVPIGYHTQPDRSVYIELILAIYSALSVVTAISLDLYLTIPFLITFLFGYVYFSAHGLKDLYER